MEMLIPEEESGTWNEYSSNLREFSLTPPHEISACPCDKQKIRGISSLYPCDDLSAGI